MGEIITATSGDAGDHWASLAASQALYERTGEKVLCTIFDHPQNKRITPDIFESWKSLTEVQPYIKGVVWRQPHHQVTHDFSSFRHSYGYGQHLAYLQANWVQVYNIDYSKKWIHLPTPVPYDKNGPVVIARSVRYHNDKFPWKKLIEFFGEDILCVNPDEEYNQLRNEVGMEFPRHKCHNFLELATTIAKSRLFICNQTSLWHVAEGMKHPRVQETHPEIHDSIMWGDNVTYSVDGDLTIADPKTWKTFEHNPHKKRKKVAYTKPMVIALPYMSKEREQWFFNLRYYRDLQDYSQYHAHIVCGYDTDESLIYGLAKQLFGKVDVSRDSQVATGWPHGPNRMFRFTADLLKDNPFFFLESDNIPTQEYWLDRIYEEYINCGKGFMGALVKGNVKDGHMNGSGIYPTSCQNYAAKLFEETQYAFDLWAADEIRPHCHFSSLFQHVWEWRGVPPTFGSHAEVSHLIDPNAVIFHRNKDNTLARFLKERISRDLKRQLRIKDVMQGMPYPGWHFKDDFGNYVMANSFNSLVERVNQTYRNQKRNTSGMRERVLEYMTGAAPYQMVEEIWT